MTAAAVLWVFVFFAPADAAGRQVGPMTEQTCKWLAERYGKHMSAYSSGTAGTCVPVERTK